MLPVQPESQRELPRRTIMDLHERCFCTLWHMRVCAACAQNGLPVQRGAAKRTTGLQKSCIERVYVCGRLLSFTASGCPLLTAAVTEAEA